MRRFIVAAAVAVALVLPASTAFASANENASCLGLAFSEHGPAHEVSGIVHEVGGLLAANDVSLGKFVSEFAQVHAGTHVPGCEVAAEEILGDLLG